MTDAAHSPTRTAPPLTWPLIAILGITLWRVGCLAFNRVDLFMDEAQYWLWGQELALGYYSKPPLVGWAIRAATELGGSDAAFWVRLPGPVAYGIAGVLVSLIATRIWPGQGAAWAGPAFVTLPGIAILSQFISTDDLLFPCFALAMLAWLRLAAGRGAGWAVTLGAAVGLGMLAKYAMIYFVGLAAIAWLMRWPARIPAARIGLAALVALLVFAPNIWWNIDNGLITLTHTAENAGWQALELDWAGAGAFLGTQYLAFGPILGAAFVLALIRARGADRGGRRMLILFSVAIFAAVALQALIRHANGNWAAPAFVAGTALAAPWLWQASRRWFGASMVLNGAVAVLLPLTAVFPDALTVRGQNPFERTMGLRGMSAAAFETARAEGLAGIAAADRMVLAELAYRSKGTGIAVYAWPVPEVPDSHYALTRPLTEAAGPVLYVSERPIDGCARALTPVGQFTSERGPDRIRNLTFARLEAPCPR